MLFDGHDVYLQHTLNSVPWHINWFYYCKFGYVSENLFFANSVKRHICDVNNLEQGMIYLYQ